jgi:transposase-like protein
MPKSKYKKQYAEELVEYFKRFIELRDDPDVDSEASRHGMVTVDLSGGRVTVTQRPCAGYPSLVKFAIKIGVTPQTLNNWRDKHDEFREAMEFADLIQDEVLNERALAGSVDGRVAMKIRELKMNARKEDANGADRKITLVIESDGENDIPIQKWTGEVNEDTGYKV